MRGETVREPVAVEDTEMTAVAEGLVEMETSIVTEALADVEGVPVTDTETEAEAE